MAKKKIKKTLPEHIMDAHQVNYEHLELNILDKTDEEITQLLDHFQVKKSDIYKTLAAHGDKTGPVVAVLPITQHLSTKKLASASHNKKVKMIPMKELEKTTGYIHGANNPVGIWQNKKFPIYFDMTAQNADYIIVSAGELGQSDKVNPQQMATLVQADFADLLEHNDD
ncbi:aminoacyl-tRNA deacylase [Leuconostoc fallax]|nr:aminoacyl-tRNA deacylase [Leuconostoc fallax]MBU7456147.1 aminoacyl-tRNA deacylase [Leuconostoc fallax]MCO6184175.1 aminoacyl-tRNA deacylase [Leuconostoc fallax]